MEAVHVWKHLGYGLVFFPLVILKNDLCAGGAIK